MGDWLGTGTIAPRLREYRPFEEAREFARKLNLQGSVEWFEFCKGNIPEKGKLPCDIPQGPNKTYAGEGWCGYGDWLGTKRLANYKRKFASFNEARKFARNLNLNTRQEWKAFCMVLLPKKGILPPNIPSNPNRTYQDAGWSGMGDWLGTGRIAPHLVEYRSFEEARKFAHSLQLSSQAEWRQFCKGNLPSKGYLPADIPANPNQTYANRGWISMGDWLGTRTVAPQNRRYRSFEEAREFARSVGLKSRAQWIRFCREQTRGKGRLPEDIPAKPERVYANKGWAGMSDWLGTELARGSKS
jgi:hypothetical protein